MVLRILSTTTWEGLQSAMCFSNSSQIDGSTVPSTYSFNIASSSSHFIPGRSNNTEPQLTEKLQALGASEILNRSLAFGGINECGHARSFVPGPRGNVLTAREAVIAPGVTALLCWLHSVQAWQRFLSPTFPQ